MAKSKSFFGLRKGSTKTMTYSVLRGQQITKDRVTDIANPRTMDQTLQRIPFAQAVKFYKQATKGLFRFAFEDKRPLESDYNAFMRHNVKYASSVSIDNYRDADYPAVGGWLLSQGSIDTPEYAVTSAGLVLPIDAPSSDVSTVGAISELILAHYDYLVEGDIITFVAFNTGVTSSGTYVSGGQPTMIMAQFVLDTTSESSIEDLGFAEVADGDPQLIFNGLTSETLGAGAVIVSRNTPSGLKVSESFLKGNTQWNAVMTLKVGKQVMEGDAYSWGATEKAILQGSLSD